jgi:hypothetical protein
LRQLRNWRGLRSSRWGDELEGGGLRSWKWLRGWRGWEAGEI